MVSICAINVAFEDLKIIIGVALDKNTCGKYSRGVWGSPLSTPTLEDVALLRLRSNELQIGK
jgi:hypothetical protein